METPHRRGEDARTPLKRILLLCPEPLAHRRPAGVGIRFLEIARVLRQDGHSVTILSPDGGAVEGCEAAVLNPENIASSSAAADAAVVQGHAANDFFAHASAIPTAVDLYDPYLIENLHYYPERGGEVFAHDHATLLNSLLHGDVFLCASEAQRLFYLGAMTAVGRVNPALVANDPSLQALLRIAPFGVHDRGPLPEMARSPAVLFGAIYDWYDPIAAIDAVRLASGKIPGLTLTFTRHPNPALTPQGKLAEAISYVGEKRLQDIVRFEPWIPYADRDAFYRRFRLTLLTFSPSIETDLAMRTRVYDSLWAGLPVITSSAPGTDELLLRYGAGVVMKEKSAEAFADLLAALLSDEGRLQSMRTATHAFVADHQWERVLAPLRDWCAQPQFDGTRTDFAVRFSVPEQTASIFDRLRRRIGGRR
ncbi:MAG TPA: glycosyltransferase [Thermoanaerobaculia bacterium]|nr:glycosyltransferase [Thermoanaerobaculia bacterium]